MWDLDNTSFVHDAISMTLLRGRKVAGRAAPVLQIQWLRHPACSIGVRFRMGTAGSDEWRL